MKTETFAVRGEEGVLVWYFQGDAYMVIFGHTNRILESKDVVFDEDLVMV